MSIIKPNEIFVTAEAGINHNGDLETAKKLIDLAADNGADCIKFQKRVPTKIYTKEELAKTRTGPDGNEITDYKWKHKLEFCYEEYSVIDRYCKELGIQFTASPWDIDSLRFLMQFDIPYIKIASASVTDTELLKAACQTKKPLFISTGMCDFPMIDKVVNFIEKNNGKLEVIYHCSATYPTSIEEVNLRGINTLQVNYPQYHIGFSSHYPSPKPCVWAAVLGARAIECHVTLNRAMYGSDQAASIEPLGFQRMMGEIRQLPEFLGNGNIEIYDSEKPIIKKLRRINSL